MANIELSQQEVEIILDYLPPSYLSDTPKEVKELKSKIFTLLETK